MDAIDRHRCGFRSRLMSLMGLTVQIFYRKVGIVTLTMDWSEAGALGSEGQNENTLRLKKSSMCGNRAFSILGPNR